MHIELEIISASCQAEWFSCGQKYSFVLYFLDPLSMGPQKALETIGANLQKQYENWQPRVSIPWASPLQL